MTKHPGGLMAVYVRGKMTFVSEAEEKVAVFT